MMYTSSDLKKTTHEGEKYITFQLTQSYMQCQKMDTFGKFIKKTKMGIIFHTTYTGKTLETMKASFNINISKFRKNKSVWFDDAVNIKMYRVRSL